MSRSLPCAYTPSQPQAPPARTRPAGHQRTSSVGLLRTNSNRSQTSVVSAASSASSSRSMSPAKPTPIQTSSAVSSRNGPRTPVSPATAKRTPTLPSQPLPLSVSTLGRRPFGARTASGDIPPTPRQDSFGGGSQRPSSPLVQPPISASPTPSISAQLASASSDRPPSRPLSRPSSPVVVSFSDLGYSSVSFADRHASASRTTKNCKSSVPESVYLKHVAQMMPDTSANSKRVYKILKPLFLYVQSYKLN